MIVARECGAVGRGHTICIRGTGFQRWIACRRPNWYTRCVKVVTHDTEIVRLVVVAGVAAVKQGEVMAKFMHGDTGSRMCRHLNTLIGKGAERNDGIVTKYFRFAI